MGVAAYPCTKMKKKGRKERRKLERERERETIWAGVALVELSLASHHVARIDIQTLMIIRKLLYNDNDNEQVQTKESPSIWRYLKCLVTQLERYPVLRPCTKCQSTAFLIHPILRLQGNQSPIYEVPLDPTFDSHPHLCLP